MSVVGQGCLPNISQALQTPSGLLESTRLSKMLSRSPACCLAWGVTCAHCLFPALLSLSHPCLLLLFEPLLTSSGLQVLRLRAAPGTRLTQCSSVSTALKQSFFLPR